MRALYFATFPVFILTVGMLGCKKDSTPKKENPVISKLILTPESATAEKGDTVSFSYKLLDQFQQPINGPGANWESSSSTVMKVTADGKGIAVGDGDCLISATVSGVTGKANVKIVAQKVSTLIISPDTISISVDESIKFSVKTFDKRGVELTGRIINYSSSDSSVAKVDKDGTLTGRDSGTANITAEAEGRSVISRINVKPLPVERVVLSKSSISLFEGETAIISATVYGANNHVLTGKLINWSSNDTSVFLVKNGNLKAIAAGQAQLTANVEGKIAKATVIVSEIPVGSVVISPVATKVRTGLQLNLTATVKDINGKVITDRPILWESKDVSKATVINGLVKTIAPGTVQIIVSCGGVSASITLQIIALSARVNYTTFQNQVLNLQPWFGSKIVLLTQSSDLDISTVENILQSLDNGYLKYDQITGRQPTAFSATVINGRATIASVNTTCGGACGYVGFTGIEMINQWIQELYDDVKNTGRHHTTLFYEIGRNHWFYSDQLYFGTGYTVDVATGYSEAMKNIVTDLIKLPIRFTEQPVRTNLESYASIYKNDLNWDWKHVYETGQAPNGAGGQISSHLLFASLILYFYNNHGKEVFVNNFFQEVGQRKKTSSIQDAVDNLVIALSVGAGKNLSKVLVKDWRFNISANAITELQQRLGNPI